MLSTPSLLRCAASPIDQYICRADVKEHDPPSETISRLATGWQSVSEPIVLFGTGSTVIVDFEESARRIGLTIVAGVRNRPGDCHLSPGFDAVAIEQLTDALRMLPFLVPLFTPAHRQTAALEAADAGFLRAASLVDPTAAVPDGLVLGDGSYVSAGCTIGGATRLGAWVFVNRGANVGHHARLADFASIGPGAVTGGHVVVGRGAVIGTGATILPGITIGANAVVSAGAVVSHDVPDGSLVAGHPARIVRRDAGGYKGTAVR